MPLMLDNIRRYGLHLPQQSVDQEHLSEFKTYAAAMFAKLQGNIPALEISNVSEYYFQGTAQEMWSLEKHFPNLAPPFEVWWAEHKYAKRCVSEEFGDQDWSGVKGHIGALHQAILIEKVNFGPNRIKYAGAKWALINDLFLSDMDGDDKFIIGPVCSILIAVDEHGAYVGPPPLIKVWRDTTRMDGMAYEYMCNYGASFHPMWLAVSFMHCRNVRTVAEQPPKPLSKKFQSHTGRPLATYHRIVIDPIKQVLRHEGRSHEVGVPRAIEICRGHFKDYSRTGLFGKYKGVFWWDGWDKRGQTQHEYVVKGPK